MEAPWYAISDMPPPYTIHVWVLWEGRRFRAVRGRHLKTGADVWAAVRDGGQLQIINRIGTTGAPRLWQPLHPDKWAGLLPVPVSPVINTGTSQLAASAIFLNNSCMAWECPTSTCSK